MKVSFKTVYPDGTHRHVGEVECVWPAISRGQFWYQFDCNIVIRSGVLSRLYTSHKNVIITPRYLRTFLRIFLYRFEGKIRCKVSEWLHLPMLLYPLFTAHEFWIDYGGSDIETVSGEFRRNFLDYLDNIVPVVKQVTVAPGTVIGMPLFPRLHSFGRH